MKKLDLKPQTGKYRDLLQEVKRIILEEPMTRYIIYITSVIAYLVVFQSIYDGFVSVKYGFIPFLSPADKLLARDFIGWFGVLYGVLMPLILIRVWEQFDKIDSVFDREADAIKTLVEDLLLLNDQYSETRTKILEKLFHYSRHVRNHHVEEIKFTYLTDGRYSKKDIGTQYLKEVRDLYKGIIHPVGSSQPEVSPLVLELLRELNTIIDLRGDRISLSSERLFESLKILAIIISTVWLVPFYFLYFPEGSLGIFGWLLVIAVTFIVIMMLTIIDDLDNPFGGYWRININSWEKLVADIGEMLGKEELLAVKKSHPVKFRKRTASKKSQR